MRIPLVSWLFSILYYWIFFSIDISVGSGQCLEDQRSLLLQLQNNLQFNSLNSSKLKSWNRRLDCCHWNGVTCDEEGHVTGLDLSGESISGGFDNSSALFSFKYLQNLNLAYNNFSAAIPSGFKKLNILSSLNLSNAGFVEQIPNEISQLTRLVILDISTLSYLGGPTLKLKNPNLMKLVQNLTEVRELYLDGISISAKGHEWCHALSSSLPHLQVLSMSSCNLLGPIHSSLKTLKNLSIIRLDQNNLSSPAPEFFADLSNLTTLDLSSCGLRGRFPKEIFQLQSLSSLDLSDNIGLQGSLPTFPQNGSLQTLILSDTNFSGALPHSISNLRQLSKLDISNCQFNGKLPYSMSNLTELTYLDLSFNHFRGPIPPFGMAKKLNHIDLSHNALSGGISSAYLEGLLKLVSIDLRNNLLNESIPSSLFALPLLQSIQLSNNHFQGQLDGISSVSSLMLETLDLSSNNLKGPIPDFIFHLTRLDILQLSSNNFNGTIQLDRILRLENLTTLDLSYNNLSIDVNAKDANLSSFPQMTTVKLAFCKLRELPGFLRNQSRLSNLDLSNNQIRGAIPNWIWHLDHLSQLNLSHNFLSEIERSPRNLSFNLFILDLHDNTLQGSLPEFPKFASYLDYSSNCFHSVISPDIQNYLSFTIFLSLSHNFLRERIPDSICNASYLQVLDLSFNKFDGMIPHCLAQSETLGVLNLGSNNLSGTIPDTFQASCALKTLNLNGNNLHGPIPKSLSNCKTLEVLDLGNNTIHGHFPCLLKKLPTLRVLVLRKNNFNGSIGCPRTGGIWKMLQIVDLAFNNFTGTLPGKCFTTWKAMITDEDQAVSKLNHLHFEFFKFSQVYYQDQVMVTSKGLQMTLNKILTVFTSIDFSSNHIEGSIPEEMMDFRALHGLNLSNNALTGQIPSSIGNLKQLESLDLSSNSFRGEIPTQLASLSFLSFLNLSFNQLVGKIPVGTQLQSFDAASFARNEGLCGPPLTKNCSDRSGSPEGGSPEVGSPKVVNTDSGVEFDWQFVCTGVGFGVGAGLVVALLMLWDRGRTWSNNSIDKILIVILPMIGLAYTPIGDDESEDDDTDEQESEMEEDNDCNEEDSNFDYPKFRGEYCVFCSKLDISMKKAIHDPSCTRHHSPSNSTSSCSSDSYSP